jgi:hypothetical protein
VGLRPLACLDCGFEIRLGHACLLFVIVACCQVGVSATGRSLAKRSPTECVVSSERDLATQTWGRLGPPGAGEPREGGGGEVSDKFNIQNSLKRKDSLL